MCGLFLFLPYAFAAETSLEFQVKAAFLLNFAKFVDWPPTAFPGSDSPITICIFGKDPFGRGIDDLVQGESVSGRRVAVRRIAQAPPAQSCQIFYTEQPGKEISEVLNGLGPHVLTVGEGEDFTRGGGMISFLVESRHVRFDIDRKAAEAADLKLSSKLFAVARSVRD